MLTGENLRMLRIINGFKQKYVANKLGITQQAYSKLEKKDVIKGILLEKVMQCMHFNREDIEMINRILHPEATASTIEK